MASSAFPALAINTQGESPLNLLGKIEQIKSAQQSQEMGSIQLQQARINQQSQQVLMEAYAKNNGDLNQTLADARASGKVTPNDLLGFQEKSVAIQTNAAKLTETQLANTEKEQNMVGNELESFKALPVEQRTPDALKASLGRLAAQGVDVSKMLPAFQSVAQNPSDENIRNIEIGYKGAQWVLNNEKALREAASAPSVSQAQAENAAKLQKAQTDALIAQRTYDNMPQPTEAKTERAAKLLEEQSTAAKNFAETAKIKAETALAQQEPVEGTDPITKVRVVVPRTQAGRLIDVTPLTADQFQKEANMSGRFGTVAQNYGKYEASLKELGKIEHPDDIAQVISDQTLGNKAGHFLGIIPSADLVAGKEVVKATADAWNRLNPDERKATLGYLQVVGGIITYNKAVDDTGRANEVAIHLEKSNIPTPLEEKHIALQHLQGNKDNIRNMIPVIPRFEHMEDPNEYLKAGEAAPIGGGQSQQQRPLINLGMPNLGLSRAADRITGQ